MLCAVCLRSKRGGTRMSFGSGGTGSVGGSDSISEIGMDPTDFPGAAQGASATKRAAFLEGGPFGYGDEVNPPPSS
jgi:hypothetical protein